MTPGPPPRMIAAAQRTAGNAAVVQRLRTAGGTPVDLDAQTDPFLLRVIAELTERPTAPYVMVEGVKFLTDAGDAGRVKKRLTANQRAVMKRARRTSPYKDYDAYAAKLGEWRDKRAAKPNAALATGSFLYHGTTKAAALLIKDSRLGPAEPGFRGGAWDASRDGFLSMATALGGATPGILLRMTVQDGDVADFAFKRVSATEVVTRFAILPERLEWAVSAKDGAESEWKPLGELV